MVSASSTVLVALLLLAVLTTNCSECAAGACADLKLQPQAIEASVGKMRPVAYVLLAVGCLLVPVCLVNWALTSL